MSHCRRKTLQKKNKNKKIPSFIDKTQNSVPTKNIWYITFDFRISEAANGLPDPLKNDAWTPY